MTEEEYWDLLDELAEETERGNQIIINSGGNLDDQPTYISKEEA